jgi:prepilin-type N-terminal cleavage/methylation domain-containing protein
MRKQLGFTLIELLVVIAIIAILVAILIPALGAATRLSNRLKDQSQIRGIDQALFTWASKQKSNNFPPIRDFGPPMVYGGSAADVFHELISADGNCKPDGHNPDGIKDELFCSPVARNYIFPAFTWPGTSGGPDYYCCSYGFLNSQTVNRANSMGDAEWRNNGAHQVPLVANRFDPAANNHDN